ncbi:MAG TPA: hypothetical protein VFC63_19860 [Blastocatellia bacterium]|nr:hypothetical protein [Blastocatellia bacterium]
MGQWLDKVNRELDRYEHPLFVWSAEETEHGVTITISLKPTLTDSEKVEPVYDEQYHLTFTPRELEEKGFAWSFQRQIYNCLHDYIVEMFIRTPQREQ